eukprot:8800466-Karenia_brevis.AAC.1
MEQYGMTDNAKEMRRKIAEELRENEKRYKDYWQGEKPQEKEEQCTWEQYLVLMAKAGSWLGALEIQCAVQKLQTRIT